MKIYFGYKQLFITLLLFLCIGGVCIYSFLFRTTRLYVKEVQLSDITVKWFNYSYISNVTTYYIIAEKENKVDTLCISDQVADFYIKKDTIFIDLYNPPQLRNIIPEKTFGYVIVPDSTMIKTDNNSRFSFKK